MEQFNENINLNELFLAMRTILSQEISTVFDNDCFRIYVGVIGAFQRTLWYNQQPVAVREMVCDASVDLAVYLHRFYWFRIYNPLTIFSLDFVPNVYIQEFLNNAGLLIDANGLIHETDIHNILHNYTRRESHSYQNGNRVALQTFLPTNGNDSLPSDNYNVEQNQSSSEFMHSNDEPVFYALDPIAIPMDYVRGINIPFALISENSLYTQWQGLSLDYNSFGQCFWDDSRLSDFYEN